MAKIIIMVQIIDGEELLTKKTKTFTDPKKAESYFAKILREDFKVTSEADIEECTNDGYFADDTHFSVILCDVTLEDE